MNLPSFLWLWRIAAWSMGLTMLAYSALALTGWGLRSRRLDLGNAPRPDGFRTLHLGLGLTLVSLVLVLLSIGIIGTIGEYGRLGHSIHLAAGLGVTALTLGSAFTGLRQTGELAGRHRHVAINVLLFAALLGALGSGWVVVQKYLP